jgi:glycosyltransferase involved in cell wall biosynthesis
MKNVPSVAIVSMKDNNGGAFYASYRLLQGLIKFDFSAHMLVQIKHSQNPKVIKLSGKENKISNLLRKSITKIIIKLLGNKNNPDQTLALYSSGLGQEINKYPADVINLHWVAGEMLSIKEISKISKPVIWTLHDFWAIQGIAHYDSRNYGPDTIKSIIDLEKIALKKKIKFWKRPVHIVVPSNYVSSIIKSSELMKDWPIKVIPNIIDTNVFQPLDKSNCRINSKLDVNKTIILFGAFAGIVNKNKGFEILMKALDEININLPDNTELVIFGQNEPLDFKYGKFKKLKWVGHIDDESQLSELYNSADIVVVPSKVEAFGLIAAEAHACGVPVVAFRHSGIQEVVSHKKTGYLAKSFDSSDFAFGILWTLNNTNSLTAFARQKACEEWSPDIVIPKYMELYKSVYEDFSNKASSSS